MKIRLKTDTLFVINELLQRVYGQPQPTELSQKIYLSVVFDLADKFDKLQKTNIKKARLSGAKKEHTMTLKFHEGWALYNIIVNFLPLLNDHYCQTVLQAVADRIHQQLQQL